jgi:hypothetical protein
MKRGPRRNPAVPEMEALNARNAARNLNILINANFKKGDSHIILTYAGDAPASGEAAKHFRNFIRRLSRLYKSFGIPLRWISSTEYANSRIHHHLIISGGVPLDAVSAKWNNGGIRGMTLYSRDYRALAEYLIKETRKTFRDPDNAFKRRYNCSRNLARPEARVEFVSAAAIEKDPVPAKGYYIDPETVYRGANPFTGGKYIEYTMISLADGPQMKKRGRVYKPRSSGGRGWFKRNGPKQQIMALSP